MRKMYGLIATYLVVSGIFMVVMTMHRPVTAEEHPWWDDTFDYRQMINLPDSLLSTSSAHAPIDISINFTDPCWARNSTHHSIRVVLQTDQNFNELESQLYQLNFSQQSYLISCNIVFILPDSYNGEESIYIYYDDQQKTPPSYQKRVSLEESQYYYEPVIGYQLSSWFYAIKQSSTLIYTVAQEGNFIGNPISQQVTKMKPDTETFTPQETTQTASFAFSYWYRNNENWKKITTASNLVSKEILVKGNLMVKFGIVSSSKDDIFQTTAIYTYYYCPTEEKRLQVDVTHELIADSAPSADAIDVFFASMTNGGFSSTTYDDLNFGEIPPYLHVYTNENQIVEYRLTKNPDSAWEPILGRKANSELGSPGWISLDNGENQDAHALILANTQVINQGINENDGVEIQAYEEKLSEQPGVTSTSSYVYLSRNTYEPDTGRDSILPDNYKISYSAEFYSVQTKGYTAVSSEANLFSDLNDLQPKTDEEISGDESQKGSLQLTVIPLLTPALQFEYLSSKLALSGASIIAELHTNEGLYASSVCSRIETSNGTSIQWKNSSLLLHADFTSLPENDYLIKIMLTNSLLSKTDRFIGVETVDLTENKSIYLLCRQQATLTLQINDQTDNSLSNVTAMILLNDLIVSKEKTDDTGKLTLTAPCSLLDKDYTLQTRFQGFILDQTDITLGIQHSIIPLQISKTFTLFDYRIRFIKADNTAFASPVTITLSSEAMDQTTLIRPELSEEGSYLFNNLYPATYNANMRYDTFHIQKSVTIQDTTEDIIQLRDLIIQVKDTWNLTPAVPLDFFVSNEKYITNRRLTADTISNGVYLFTDLYPASYTASIGYKSFQIKNLYDLSTNVSIQETIIFPASYNLSVTAYDSHGSSMADTTIIVQRNEKQESIKTNNNGKTKIIVPPATYTLHFYNNNESIATRNVIITNQKSLSVVTTQAPLYPILIWIAGGMIILLAALFIRRKRTLLPVFILVFITAILFSVMVFPWWANTGSTDQINHTTTVYLLSHSITSFTETETVEAGEIITPSEQVLTLMIASEVFVVTGGILLIISILIALRKWKKTMILLIISSIILLSASLLIFQSSMSAYTESSVGSVTGEDPLVINIPGEESTVTVDSSWGYSTGFYAVIFLILVLVLYIIGIMRSSTLFTPNEIK